MDIFNISGYKLDETQIKAIEDDGDHVLIVAGAGSGKTLTILGKIKYLIEVKKMKQEDILCISFTNEAVNSLNEKVNNLGYKVDTKTFHKLALSILNKINIVSDNYLEFIVDEYFESYIKYDHVLFIKSLFFETQNKQKIFDVYEFLKLKQTVITFIRLAKSNNLDLKNIYAIYNKTFFNEKKIIKIILDIMLIYKEECESINGMDFDDMIIISAEQVKNVSLKYKYIIIDEFQDTSLVRLKLIKEIINNTNAKLLVVGDDWQSIYRFSGCDLNIFLNFKMYFPDCHTHYLRYTYRNSLELIKISSKFVMKNKRQLKKYITSNKNNLKPIKIVFNYNILELIEIIDNKNILIIGRTNKDIKNINWANKLTIHKSKGLESDNVILVNSDNIPSKVKEEKILRHINHQKDYLLYEEERRLFYVALTRTKNNIYIMVNKKISPFVKELIHDNKNYVEIIKKS